MFADPSRMHAELIGVDRLGSDVGNELVRIARVILVVIVAQREVAKFHDDLSPNRSARRFSSAGAGEQACMAGIGGRQACSAVAASISDKVEPSLTLYTCA